MSRVLHRLYLDRLIPTNWSDVDPPILLNTWEAKYFHVNHNNVVEMAERVSGYFVAYGGMLDVWTKSWCCDRRR